MSERNFALSRQQLLAKRLALRNQAGTFGNVYFVVKSTESYLANFIKQFQVVWEDGSSSILNTVEEAYAAMVSNRNDVCVLDTNSTHAIAAMVTTSKNRVHFVSLDYFMGINRANGARAKISMGVTTEATDIAAFLNTGEGNSFIGIKVISNNTKDESLYSFVDAGEYTYMKNCEIYKSTDLDVTGSAEFVCNADNPTYENVVFGSLADARVGAILRPTVLFTKELGGSGKVTRDALFRNCQFWIQAADTANRFVYGANANDIERSCVFEDCIFINNGASSSLPAQNIAFGATLTVGKVLVRNCSALNASTAMSTTTGVFVDGGAPTAGTTGIAVQAS